MLARRAADAQSEERRSTDRLAANEELMQRTTRVLQEARSELLGAYYQSEILGEQVALAQKSIDHLRAVLADEREQRYVLLLVLIVSVVVNVALLL